MREAWILHLGLFVYVYVYFKEWQIHLSFVNEYYQVTFDFWSIY